jgi:hypothetical protein
MSMGDLIKILIGACLIWFGWQFADPYWNKYWLTKEIEKAATFGTKRGEEAVRGLLTDAFNNYGIQKTGNDCYVYKDERNFVTVKCEYDAKVEVFGELLHTYRIKIQVTKKEEFNKFF